MEEKGEKMKLTEQFIQKQKDLLAAEKEKIEEQIKKLTKYPDYGELEGDNAQELTDYENNLSIDDQLESVLKKVKGALKAINDGTYGLCKQCQESIEQGRLKIMPYADLCVTCQQKKRRR